MERMHIQLYDYDWEIIREEDIRGNQTQIIEAFERLVREFPWERQHVRFLVDSEFGNGTTYVVDHYEDGSTSCTCRDYIYRQAERGGRCKHIAADVESQRGSIIPTGRNVAR